MSTDLLDRPQTVNFKAARASAARREFEPNFGPEDIHAIKAIAYLMNGIFLIALVMYGTITCVAWLGS